MSLIRPLSAHAVLSDIAIGSSHFDAPATVSATTFGLSATIFTLSELPRSGSCSQGVGKAIMSVIDIILHDEPFLVSDVVTPIDVDASIVFPASIIVANVQVLIHTVQIQKNYLFAKGNHEKVLSANDLCHH